ncbi:hypothetical protein RhiirB3_438135 [Rhizophagus irregularis]|nr:hypothetical protein RhiirB3_438135 [Rhizophagus irregularis]
MASSKILLGYMPELLNDIIQYLQDDYRTLHSCILINKLWCRLAIPFLWKNPFSIKYPKNYCYIDVYLHNLNEDDKTKLNEYGIKISVFSSNTLFNYSSFFKCLKTCDFKSSIEDWMSIKNEYLYQPYKKNSGKTPIINDHFSGFYSKETKTRDHFFEKFFIGQSSQQQLLRLIYTSLIERFVKNEANLHTFEFNGNYYENIILEIILQNPKFIHNIRNLFITFISNNEVTALLKLLLSNHNSISKFHFQFQQINNNIKINELIKNYSSQVINSQHNLKKLIFEDCDTSTNVTHLNHLLLSLKDSNCLNTLETIIFYKINFEKITSLKEVFEQLNVLESIHIIYCSFKIHRFVQQIIHITKPFKLKSLFVGERIIERNYYSENYDITLIINSMQLLFQKSGKYLENIGLFYSIDFKYAELKELKEKSLELIKNYCKNVKHFNSDVFSIQSAHLVLNSIKNFKQNLNYLTIESRNNEFSSIILLNLGQILPCSLEYLCLDFYNAYSSIDLEVFLKNLKNTFIEKLILSISSWSDDILRCIKKYIMKKKRVKYLAINVTEQVLANEAKEFKLYNIEFTSMCKIYNYLPDLL